MLSSTGQFLYQSIDSIFSRKFPKKAGKAVSSQLRGGKFISKGSIKIKVFFSYFGKRVLLEKSKYSDKKVSLLNDLRVIQFQEEKPSL